MSPQGPTFNLVGCNAHMRNTKHMFDYITPINDTTGYPLLVQQGDGSYLTIQGCRQVTEVIQGYTIRSMAYFVPDLGCSLFSVWQHACYQGCHFHAKNNLCSLAFPTFILTPKMDPEIMVVIETLTQSTNLHFDETTAPLATDQPTAKGLVAKLSYIQPTFSTEHKTKLAEEVIFQLQDENTTLPTRGSDQAIGFDITSINNVTIPPNTSVKVHTGLTCTIPTGIYGRLASRSSLAAKSINVQGWVIDPDYRGEILVIMQNSGPTPYHIKQGNRVAQLIFEQASTPLITLSYKLPPSQQGTGGFGSTNKGGCTSSSKTKPEKSPKRHKVYHIGKDTYLVPKKKKIQITPSSIGWTPPSQKGRETHNNHSQWNDAKSICTKLLLRAMYFTKHYPKRYQHYLPPILLELDQTRGLITQHQKK